MAIIYPFPRLRRLQDSLEGFERRINKCDNKGLIKTVVAINEELNLLKPIAENKNKREFQAFLNLEVKYGKLVRKFESDCKCMKP